MAGGTTLVIYMGLKNLPAIVASLREAGMAAGMPVAVVQNGTLPTQKQVVSTLAQVTAAVTAAHLQSPALVVVGEVVRYASVANIQTVIEEARKSA